jgi:hypothetical protein
VIDEVEWLLCVEGLPERMSTSQPVEIDHETRKAMSRLGSGPAGLGHLNERQATLSMLLFPPPDCGHVLGADEHDAIAESMQRANETPAGTWFRATAGLACVRKHEQPFAR